MTIMKSDRDGSNNEHQEPDRHQDALPGAMWFDYQPHRLGPQRYRIQPEVLFQAAHEVCILDCLPGRAFGQIIDD